MKALKNKKLAIYLVFIMVFALLAPGLVLSGNENPLHVVGNDKDIPEGYVDDYESFKFGDANDDAVLANGRQYLDEEETMWIEIELYDNENGDEVVDWESNFDISAVFVKGGPNGYLYQYDPASRADQALRAPDNLGEEHPDISHITFFYSVPDQDGTLTIVKELFIDNVKQESSDTEFYFNILKDDTIIEGGANVAASVDQSFSIDLAPGEYAVQEIDPDAEDGDDPYELTGVVVSGETTVVTFQNYLQTPDVGDDDGTLTIVKELFIDNAKQETSDTKFYFNILKDGTIIEGGANVVASVDQSFSIDLAPGTYTVQEIDPDAEEGDDPYELIGDVEAGEETVVTFQNYLQTPDVRSEDGTLIIKKVVMLQDEDVSKDDNGVFEFEIFNSANEKVGNTIFVKAGEQSDPIELSAGKYTVREVNIDGVYYELDVEDQTVTIVDGEQSSVQFINNLLWEDEEEEAKKPAIEGADEEETLPVTSGTDFLLLGLGAAMTTGGLVLRRRKRK